MFWPRIKTLIFFKFNYLFFNIYFYLILHTNYSKTMQKYSLLHVIQNYLLIVIAGLFILLPCCADNNLGRYWLLLPDWVPHLFLQKQENCSEKKIYYNNEKLNKENLATMPKRLTTFQ